MSKPREILVAAVIGLAIGYFVFKPAPKMARELVVTQEEYGARWPWPKFDRGVIRCHDDQVTIAMGSGPVVYGLNGRAQSRGGYLDSRMVMERVPGTAEISAYGLGLFRLGASSELIQRGLALCREAAE